MSIAKTKKRTTQVLIFFLSIILSLTAMLMVCLIFILDNQPVVSSEMRQIEPQAVQNAKNLAKRMLYDIQNAEQAIDLTIRVNELDSLTALLTRAIPNTKMKVNISNIGLLGAITTRLPDNPFGQYLNLWVLVNPSTSGLLIESVKLGKITISGDFSYTALQLVLDLILGDKHGTKLINSINSISMVQQQITININPPNLHRLKQQITSNLKKHRDKLSLFDVSDKVRFYYSYLINISEKYHPYQTHSLAEFIGPLFKQAKQRSADSAPEIENKAAILALAIYFGSERFELLVGEVRTTRMKKHRPLGKVVLAKRNDLRLHFIYSAALEILGNTQGSTAIGEFKELLDANAGGTGFSFADLAADMAGIEFAKWATDQKRGAWQSQFILSESSHESIFFPDIQGLPEGLTEREFIQKYQNTQSAKYQHMVAEINRRLNSLDLYRAKN